MKSRNVLRPVLLGTAALPAVLLLGTLAIAQTSGTQKPGASGVTVQNPASPGQSTTEQSTQPGQGAGSGGSFSQSGTSGAINDAGRMARFESHLSSIKSALQLTAEQERLWPAAESAMREAFRKQHEERERMRNASSAGSNDFVERMRQRAEMMTARGENMKRVAEAIKPLHDSLTADQKRRLVSLMRDHMRGHMADRDDRGYRGGMGQGRGPEMGYGHHGRYGGQYGGGYGSNGGWRGNSGDRERYGYQQGYRGGQAWQRDNDDGFNLYDPNWRSRSYDYDRGSRDDRRGRGWQGQGQGYQGYQGQGQWQGWRRGYDDDSYRGYGSQDRGRYGRYGEDDDRRGYGSRWREEDRDRDPRGSQQDNDNDTDDDDQDNED